MAFAREIFMGNTTKKTSKRRLKKSIRRTFGGLFLASSILVAAIPFPEAQAYVPKDAKIPPYELKDEDESAVAKLVAYLNHFTSGVMQSCANITSENARDLFVNLRKSLYKEGKNLTIFIEDFTS